MTGVRGKGGRKIVAELRSSRISPTSRKINAMKTSLSCRKVFSASDAPSFISKLKDYCRKTQIFCRDPNRGTKKLLHF
jgi:hypothetical protein